MKTSNNNNIFKVFYCIMYVYTYLLNIQRYYIKFKQRNIKTPVQSKEKNTHKYIFCNIFKLVLL